MDISPKYIHENHVGVSYSLLDLLFSTPTRDVAILPYRPYRLTADRGSDLGSRNELLDILVPQPSGDVWYYIIGVVYGSHGWSAVCLFCAKAEGTKIKHGVIVTLDPVSQWLRHCSL